MPGEGGEVIDISSRFRSAPDPTITEYEDFGDIVREPHRLLIVTEFLRQRYDASQAPINVALDYLDIHEANPNTPENPRLATTHQRDPEDTTAKRTILGVSSLLPTILQKAANLPIGEAVEFASASTLTYGVIAAQSRARKDVYSRLLCGGEPSRGLKPDVWPVHFLKADGCQILYYRFAATVALQMYGLEHDSLVERLDHGRRLPADVAGFANPASPTLAGHTAIKYLQ